MTWTQVFSCMTVMIGAGFLFRSGWQLDGWLLRETFPDPVVTITNNYYGIRPVVEDGDAVPDQGQ